MQHLGLYLSSVQLNHQEGSKTEQDQKTKYSAFEWRAPGNMCASNLIKWADSREVDIEKHFREIYSMVLDHTPLSQRKEGMLMF